MSSKSIRYEELLDLEIKKLPGEYLPNLLQIGGSPYKAMQVWKHRPVLLCKHLIFRHVSPEAMICNLLKLLTCTVL
ncbi:MAG: hypothetical protein DRH21_01065 [Deltaproteobacteria bacterium]|nr:MAG: hypothetical protein DRH21_01065 [Deltaproteobacteria bacterium]